MKKCVKILFIFFVIFSFNSVVYASDQCFYMPGKNNKIIVPKGYTARCYYQYESTKSNNGGRTNYEQMALSFQKSLIDGKYVERIYVSGAKAFDDIQTDILYLDENLQPMIAPDATRSLKSDSDYFDFDGLKIYRNSFFSKSSYDGNINGCPKSFYWIDDNTSAKEYKIGFSSTENPSLSFKSGGNYAVYSFINYSLESDGTKLSQYDDIMFIADSNRDKDNILFYKSWESDDYNKLIKDCDPETTTGNDSSGYGDQNEIISNDKVETLNSCSYYFEFKNHYKDANDTCYSPKVTFTYQKKTISGKSSLSVTSDWSDLKLDNIETKISEVDLDNPNTYSNLSDYLVYKNGKWSCADKIYVVDSKNASVPLTVFGRSRHSEFSGFYQNEITESQTSNENMCISGTKPGTNINSSINLGDKVDVSCEGILGDDLLDYIDELFTWVKIAVPIIVIIMGSLDFAQAVLQDDKDAMKKATSKFTKRCIIAVAIFFIPTLLSYILHIFNAMTTAGGISVCGIG